MLKKIGTLILPLLLLLSTNETYGLHVNSQSCKIDKNLSSDSCGCLANQEIGIFEEQPSDNCCCKVKGKSRLAVDPLLASNYKLLLLEEFSNLIFSKPISFIKKIFLIKSSNNFIHSELLVTYAPHLFRLYCSLRI